MKSNIGIQIILSIVQTMCSININAQTVGYTYRPLAAEGCNMKYSVAKQDTAYYIIATVKSDRLNFLKESTMLLKKGVAKIRLSTIPIEHERTFAKDKIGKKLYQFFLKQKNKDNDF